MGKNKKNKNNNNNDNSDIPVVFCQKDSFYISDNATFPGNSTKLSAEEVSKKIGRHFDNAVYISQDLKKDIELSRESSEDFQRLIGEVEKNLNNLEIFFTGLQSAGFSVRVRENIPKNTVLMFYPGIVKKKNDFADGDYLKQIAIFNGKKVVPLGYVIDAQNHAGHAALMPHLPNENELLGGYILSSSIKDCVAVENLKQIGGVYKNGVALTFFSTTKNLPAGHVVGWNYGGFMFHKIQYEGDTKIPTPLLLFDKQGGVIDTNKYLLRFPRLIIKFNEIYTSYGLSYKELLTVIGEDKLKEIEFQFSRTDSQKVKVPVTVLKSLFLKNVHNEEQLKLLYDEWDKENINDITAFKQKARKLFEELRDYPLKTYRELQTEIYEFNHKQVKHLFFQPAMSYGKALRNAAANGETKKLKDLLEKKPNPDVNEQDQNPTSQKTALHWAVIKNHMGCIKLLLAHSAESNIRDAGGKTAKDYAEKNEDILSLLQKAQELKETTHTNIFSCKN